MRHAVSMFLLLQAVFLRGVARAESSSQTTPSAVKAPKARKPASKEVVTVEELKVEGKVRRPSAILITAPAARKAFDAETPGSFLPKVLRPLGKDPF